MTTYLHNGISYTDKLTCIFTLNQDPGHKYPGLDIVTLASLFLPSDSETSIVISCVDEPPLYAGQM